ncbi:hypothetical protein [Glycomyces sp. NPDC021274]|uniref:hypothetical protein n=1 Tax=Glycomyces sp. NPDC021274 TaxID=3155120 RepID=UPI0033F80EF4
MSDDTIRLRRALRTPEPVADEAEAEQAAGLMAELIEHSDWVQRLMAGRANPVVRAEIQSNLRGLVAAAQALDGHLSEADRAGSDAATAAEFDHWRTAPGGER